MYRITIKTEYNIMELVVEDYNIPSVHDLIEQPHIIEIKIENLEKNKIKILKK